MKQKILKRIFAMLIAVSMLMEMSVPVSANESNIEEQEEISDSVCDALSDANTTVVQQQKKSSGGNIVIFLDPGHDDTHAGARANGLCEEQLNLKIAQYCKEELETYGGVTVYMSRESGACPNPGTTSGNDNLARVNRAASLGANAYISIHLNTAGSSAATGAEIYRPNDNYRPDLGQIGGGIAQKILNYLEKIGLVIRGVKIRNSDDSDKYADGSTTDYYGVIRNAKKQGLPAIIIEHAFLTNSNDAALLKTESGLKELGVADAKGIVEYYGLSKKGYEGAFDAAYYSSTYSDLKAAFGTDENKLLKHFLENGIYEGRVASPVFDINYYMANNPDIAERFNNDPVKCMQYFVSTGITETRRASAGFDVVSYRNANKDLRQAFGNDYKQYYMHYINYGRQEGRVATNVNTLQNAETVYQNVDYAAVYDYNYYTEHNPDVVNALGTDENDVLQHFVNNGMKEGRQASASFNVQGYRNRYADLRAVFGGDWTSYYMHYIRNGHKEGRSGASCNELQGAITIYDGIDYSAVYDYNYYVKNNPDVVKALGSDENVVLSHFVRCGISEGRQAIAGFNVQGYKNRYADLRSVYGNNTREYYMHYILYGKKEGRSGAVCNELIGATTIYRGVNYSAVYDYSYYVKNNPDVVKALGNDENVVLSHFVNNGMSEGRRANEKFYVNAYRSRYVDLQNAFGDDWKSYYIHYINCGQREGRQGN